MNLSLLSKYRTHIMGFAMIWIMWFHSPFTGSNSTMHFIHNIGFFGVDMFLMVSGLGLYFSMRKSKSIGDFYRKRAVRILPAYFIVTICWYCFYQTDVSLGDKLLSILGINYFRGTVYGRFEYFDWFIPTLIVLYLLTPLYDKLFQRATAKWKFTVLASMISPILCIVGYQLGQQVLYGSFVRIPIFLIGYNIGYFLYEKKEEKKGSWMVFISMLFVGIALAYNVQSYIKDSTVLWGLNCYPALLVAPAVSALVALIFKYAEKWLKIVGKILILPFYICGRYSLEIYLFHQRIMEIMNSDALSATKSSITTALGGSGAYSFVLMLVSVLCAAALHELIALVIRLIKKPNPPTKPNNPTEQAEQNEISEQVVAEQVA